MQSKLTLRLDKTLIENAKEYAQENGKSLSQIVADYFYALTQVESKNDMEVPEATPLTDSLIGRFADANDLIDEELRESYYDYLEEKHR